MFKGSWARGINRWIIVHEINPTQTIQSTRKIFHHEDSKVAKRSFAEHEEEFNRKDAETQRKEKKDIYFKEKNTAHEGLITSRLDGENREEDGLPLSSLRPSSPASKPSFSYPTLFSLKKNLFFLLS